MTIHKYDGHILHTQSLELTEAFNNEEASSIFLAMHFCIKFYRVVNRNNCII